MSCTDASTPLGSPSGLTSQRAGVRTPSYLPNDSTHQLSQQVDRRTGAAHLDRLGRSLRHLVETVTALADRSVGFRSLRESIDTTTPGGRLVFHVFAALAEFERDLISERTQAGLVAARARGRKGGRPSVMTPDKLAVARDMYASGEHTTAAIAAVVGVSRASLYRHLAPKPDGVSRARDARGEPST